MEYYPLSQRWGYSRSYYEKYILPKIKGKGHSFKHNNFHRKRWRAVSEYLCAFGAEMQARLDIHREYDVQHWKEYDETNDPSMKEYSKQRRDFFKKTYAERISKISKKKRHLIKLKV